MRALRPAALENARLPEALRRAAGRFSDQSGVPAEVSVAGDPGSLGPDIEVTLLRVAQETLQNVRKHAAASRVVLTLSYMGDAVVLDIRDDGKGFDASRMGEGGKGSDCGGIGLKGIRERVEAIGGTLSVESSAGKGTSLAAELPADRRTSDRQQRNRHGGADG